MRLIKLTTAVFAAALALAPASTLSAQSRRESRPSRSTSTTSRSSSGSSRTSSRTTRPSSGSSVKADVKKQPASVRPQSSASRMPAPSGQTAPAGQSQRPSANTQVNSASRRPSPAQEPKRPNNVTPQTPHQGGHAPSNPSGHKPGPAPDNHKPGHVGHIGHGGPGGPHVPPCERRPISHKNPSRFFDHGRHYYGYRVNRLPGSCHIDIFWGQKYYICDGVYYRLYDGTYYVCRPPYGYTFAYDAYAYSPVLCSFAYYSLYDRQYNIINQNYALISEQNRTIAQNNAVIAAQNAQMQQNAEQNTRRSSESYALAAKLGLVQSFAAYGTEYYYDDGVFFVKGSNGEYETILPPAGALIEALPDDYSEVTLSDGKEYYLVDDTVYRLILDSGKPYFEVLGQIQK